MRRAAGVVVFALAQAANACPLPGVEICDGIDNDGDTLVDEDENPDAGEQPLCPSGAACVVATGVKTQCAQPPRGGDFPCPAGQVVEVNPKRSGTGEIVRAVCVSLDACGGCIGEHCDEQGNSVCGADPLPPCVCHADGRCLNACAGVQCGAEYACRERDPGSGTCQPNGDCRIAGGCDAGQLCFGGACFPDPCNPNPCRPDQVCRGSKLGAQCEVSCADVTCDSGGVCVRGSCMQVTGWCRGASDAGICPRFTECRLDGECGDPPCRGVRCPDGQMCADGQCQRVKPSEDGAAPIVDASTKPAERDDEPNMPTGVKLKGVGASDTSGCGCSIPSRTANAGALTLVAMLVALTRRARRISRAKTAYLRD